MLSWLGSHAAALNLVLNAGILLVWLFYFQILLANYRNQKRPKILVNRGGGTGWDSRCLLTNMSEKVVYVYAVVARVECGGKPFQSVVTERRDVAENRSAAESRERIGQGPLGSGEMIDLGSIRDLVDFAVTEEAGRQAADAGQVDSVEVKVAAIYDSEDIIIGASRRFAVRDDGRLDPETVYTRQIRARRHRKVLADEVLRQIST